MNIFDPDLIVEVTGACNRACVGCYAPNVVTNEAAETLLDKHPELFLSEMGMRKAMNELRQTPSITSIRGGEPTLHPKISILLSVACNKSKHVYLETHGRWLLPQNINFNKELIQTIKEKKIIVKISFDKMHGMKEAELKLITDFLNLNGISFRVAITEETLSNYLVTRSLCFWVSDDNIIFQQKASREADLVRPNIATINVLGEIKKTLTHNFIEDTLGVALT